MTGLNGRNAIAEFLRYERVHGLQTRMNRSRRGVPWPVTATKGRRHILQAAEAKYLAVARRALKRNLRESRRGEMTLTLLDVPVISRCRIGIGLTIAFSGERSESAATPC